MAFPRLNQRQNFALKRPPILGTTFSQLQCRYIGLDYRETFRQISELGLDRVRLCSYWNEIEPIERQFDFSAIDWLLDQCHQHGIEVVLTVGMKAPRWPEFHFPSWLSARHDTTTTTSAIDANREIADRALTFVRAVVEHTRQAPAIKYWQVENEPFTRMEITGRRYLSHEFVRQEVELVRSLALPGQKLVLTNAIMLPTADQHEDDRAFQESLAIADAVGINVYTKVPAGNSFFYIQPAQPFWDKLRLWQTALITNDREDWIAEAQAEPWEPNKLVAIDRAQYPSSSPKQAATLVTSLTELGYRTVMLWGSEYWYWHKKNGRSQWWQTMQQIIQA